jgi:hypothetical protein
LSALPSSFVSAVQHNTTQTSMPPAGFEPSIRTSDPPQTLAWDRSATGIGRFDPRTVRPVASRYTDWALRVHRNDTLTRKSDWLLYVL